MSNFKAAILDIYFRASELRRSEKGSFSVEGVLMFPILLWAYIGMYVFFEGLRENNINLKAAYTIGDLLSRETELVDMAYFDGMNDVFGWLTRSQNPVSMRVTVVRYDEVSDSHVLVWSRGVAGKPDLIQNDVDTIISPEVPILADADTAIVVETWARFEPIMEIGLTSSDIYNLVVTPPRFAEQLMFVGVGDGGGNTHNDGNEGDTGL
ncbi:MAG: TadE/TadG family type IV pilus assembly protein [Boseongicola sp.]